MLETFRRGAPNDRAMMTASKLVLLLLAFLVTGAAADNVDTMPKRVMDPVTKVDNIEAFQTFEEDVPPVEQATITAVAAIADPARWTSSS